MSRDRTTWMTGPRRELQVIPREVWERAGISATELLNAELVTFFMTRHYPRAQLSDAPTYLDGWRVAPHPAQATIESERHRLLLLLGPYTPARRLRALLESYQTVAGTDDPTGCGRRLCAWRHSNGILVPNIYAEAADLRLSVYAGALQDPVAHKSWTDPAAIPGLAYQFPLRKGLTERIVIPPTALPAGPETTFPLAPVAERHRQPIEVTWSELSDAAEILDAARPGERFRARLAELHLTRVDDDGGREPLDSLTIDGLVHLAGLMTAGKSTLLALTAVVAARRKLRVVLCTDTVASVLSLVELLAAADINAVPILGWSGRASHAQALYERAGDRLAENVAAGQPVDFRGIANRAEWLADTCLLEPYREEGDSEYRPPLTPSEFPCNRLRPDGDPDAPRHACPLRPTCPVHAADRGVPSAQVWVTTPQALLLSAPGPLASAVRMRWLEFVQHHADLVLIDEADRILASWDHVFMPAQDLQDREQGWAGVALPIDTAKSDQPARWHSSPRAKPIIRNTGRASRALNELLHRFYGSEGDRTVITRLADRVWNEQSLLWDVAQLLVGMEPGQDAEPEILEAARGLYMDHLVGFTHRSATDPPFDPALNAIWDALRTEQPDEPIADLMEKWAASVLPEVPPQISLRRATSMFALACWAWEFSESSRFVVDHSAGLIGEQFGVDLPDWGLTQARAIRSYLPLVPDMPMGNLVGFQWVEGTEPTDSNLRMLWCRGLGRWLLHHLHDLFASEGIDGPNVLLVSATGWSGKSSLFNLHHPPDALLEVTPKAEARLAASRFTFTPVTAGYGTAPLRVSGAGRDAEGNLESIVDALFRVQGGLRSERRCWAEDVLAAIQDPNRRRIMLVVNSTVQARTVAARISQIAEPPFRENHVYVMPDSDGLEMGVRFERVLPRGRVETFGRLAGKKILIVPLLSIERGLNILNDDYNGACGAVMFLTRPHPPANDPQLALSTLAGRALSDYGHHVSDSADVPAARRELYASYRRLYSRNLAKTVQYSALGEEDRSAFAWNLIVRIWQTVGRGMRGGQPVDVYFVDAAFAPGRASGQPDQPRTSVLAAMAGELDSVCGSKPRADWSPRDRAIAGAVFSILHRGLSDMAVDRQYLL